MGKRITYVELMAKQWDSFARAVIPRDASAVQRHEMRRAFYAGAHGMIAALTSESELTDEDFQMLANIEIELWDSSYDVDT